MRTTTNHEAAARSVSARYSSFSKTLTLDVESESISQDKETITITLTPDQMKSLLRAGRNALIDAKVIRGKKRYNY